LVAGHGVTSGRAVGKTSLVFGRWRKRNEKHRADKQEGDVHALDREGDPRGGVQSEEYRNAGPTEIVESDGVAMSGPGGSPPDSD
jgi:hypothetical protein